MKHTAAELRDQAEEARKHADWRQAVATRTNAKLVEVEEEYSKARAAANYADQSSRIAQIDAEAAEQDADAAQYQEEHTR